MWQAMTQVKAFKPNLQALKMAQICNKPKQINKTREYKEGKKQ